MSKEQLRDDRGHIFATIETMSSGEKIIRNDRGHICGRYDPKANQTRDDRGHIVGTGNQLTRLV